MSATLFDPIAANFDYAHEELPIGRPLPNVTAHILNEQLQPVPMGTGGELHIGGAGVAQGYHNLPEKTAERFIPSPFEAGARLYKTGVLVRQRPDGVIEFLGRADFQVKIRGFRIEPGEIEARLEAHPQIIQQIVIVKEDDSGNKRLVAYIVPQSETTLTDRAVRDFVAEALPEYMVPSAFVFLDALTLTTNGKVDRQSLPEPVFQAETVVPPSTEVEVQLLDLWQQVLWLSAVGVTDNFFELGGTSILTIQVISKMQGLTDKPLSVVDIFQYPTISLLAKYLSQSQANGPTKKEVHQKARKRKELLRNRMSLSRRSRIHSR